MLVDQFTAEQNLALPLSLEIDDHARRPFGWKSRQLATEVGLSTDELGLQTAALDPSAQLRLRVGRALALRPRVLLAEHPNALLPREETPRFASDLLASRSSAGLPSLVMTADAGLRPSCCEPRARASARNRRPVEKRFGLRRWFS